MRKNGFLILIVVVLMGWAGASPGIVAQQDIVSLVVSAGFDGRFRENTWTPVLVTITNNGDPIEGSLVARPERSNALTNAFSTAVSLPSNARQTVMFYVSLRSFGRSLRVELFDGDGVLVTESEVGLSSLAPNAQLYAVVSNATGGALNLTGVGPAGAESVQADWFPINLPDVAGGLSAVDVLIFNDVDTGTLTAAQRTAIREWTTAGGHLIVTGGPNWQPTAAGLGELLPFSPTSSATRDDLSALSAFAGVSGDLSGQAVISIGELAEGGAALSMTDDDVVLYSRRALGNGTVDYLALDPTLSPLRDWVGLDGVWATALSSVEVRPGWTYGRVNPERSLEALEVLPGVNAIPEALAMVGFLAAYVLLIGPVNYWVLSRLNRRELAWISIPVLIVAFSALAWATGFNLRGSDVILSRLSVVQSWPDSETAQVSQLIGVLAPRRATYDLAVDGDRLLRPLPPRNQAGFFGAGVSNVTIAQGDGFSADNFLVDASRVEGFDAVGTLPRPAVSGQLTLRYTPDGVGQVLQGSVRNDADFALHDAVLLFRGAPYYFGEPLASGALVVLDAALPVASSGFAAPSPLEYDVGVFSNILPRSRYNYNFSLTSLEQSAIDLLGQENYLSQLFSFTGEISTREQELYRRQAFLNTFMIDQYNVLARGNRAYLAGWTDAAPTEEIVGGASWRAVDTTLYLIELEVTVDKPATTVTVTPDQFSWTAIERNNIGLVAPNNLTLSGDGQVAFRFTPLPEAILGEVERLAVVFERQGNTTGRSFQVNLWNWSRGEWEALEVNGDVVEVPNPARYIGPLNAVQVQLNRELAVGALFIGQLGVEQSGRF